MTKANFRLKWEPGRRFHQWFFDALQVDPALMVHNHDILWEVGTPQRVMNNRLENKSVGTTPRVLVYIGVSAEHGTLVFFPYNGARGGGDAEDNKMWEGFQYWWTKLDPQRLKEASQNAYYNGDNAKDAFIKMWSQRADDSFDARYFLVRPTCVMLSWYKACCWTC
jgi:hypothetical protein